MLIMITINFLVVKLRDKKNKWYDYHRKNYHEFEIQ